MKLKRKFYWAYPAHLKSGQMTLLEPVRFSPGMVRIRIELAPRQPRRLR